MVKVKSEWEYLDVWFKAFELLLKREKQVKEATDRAGQKRESKNGLTLKEIDRRIDLTVNEARSHRSVAAENSRMYVSARMIRDAGLNSEEEMILLYLLYQRVKSGGSKLSPTEVIPVIFPKRRKKMACFKYFNTDGRLTVAGLIEKEGADFLCAEWFASRLFEIGEIQAGQSALDTVNKELSYVNYLQVLCELSELMQKRAKVIFKLKSQSYKTIQTDQISSFNQRIQLNKNYLEEINRVPAAASFPFVRFVKHYDMAFEEQMIVVALMNRVVLERDNPDSLFSCSRGQLNVLDLSKYLAKTQDEVPSYFRFFSEKSILVKEGIVGCEESPWSSEIISEKRFGLDGELTHYLIGTEAEMSETQFLEMCLRMKDKAKICTDVTEPRFDLKDVVLSPLNKSRLLSALEQVKSHNLIFSDWGFEQKIKYGNGLAMLFAGPPGTGKTLAAEAVAGFLGKNFFVVDYSKLQSKFVGETEKNVVTTFRTARQKDAVLVFDEADTVFMDRSTAKANWEVRELNVLLQQIENFCGIVILTTNRHDCFDPALERRLALRLVFGPPDVEDRFQLWKRHIPNKAPMSSDINLEALARDYILTGAQIKNVVLGAARRAAVRISLDDKGVCITQSDILDAIHEEKELTWASGGKGRLGF